MTNTLTRPPINGVAQNVESNVPSPSYAVGRKGTPDRIRLSLDVSPELYDLLEKTATKIHGSKSDVLRKAIVLMSVVVEAQAEGKVFGVANNDNEPISKQIVGLF